MNARTSCTTQQNEAAILAGIGILSSNAAALTRDASVDRELILSVSDGFTRQAWVVDGKVSRETRETLSLESGEHVRITIANDMPGVRVITIGDGRLLRLPPGQSGAIDVTGQCGEEFTIEVIGHPAFSRPVKVQRRNSIHVKTA